MRYEDGDPRAHVSRLAKRLEVDRHELRSLWRYYVGDHPLPDATPETNELYHRILRQSISNWMGLVVDAVTERLKVVGFRADGSLVDAASAVWKLSRMNAGQELVHTDAVACSRGYALVEALPDGRRRVVVESPMQMIADYEPGEMWEPTRALKLWSDGGMHFATLYEPDVIRRYVGEGHQVSSAQWGPRQDAVGAEVPNPFGRVPVEEFRNRPDSMGGCRSDIADVTAIQDRINSTIYHRVMAAMFTAFKQKWATGLELEEDDAGNPVAPFSSDAFRLWIAENPDVTFGEFTGDDLAGYINAVESDIQHLAAVTRTPPHYLLGQSGAFPSGDSLAATETGLVAKVMERQQFFGEGWERVMSLALGVPDQALEVVWSDPESRTYGELADSTMKLATIGFPFQYLAERLGLSPAEIQRVVVMQRQEALNGQGLDLSMFAPGTDDPEPEVA